MAIFWRDVTDRKQAEAALRKAGAPFARVMRKEVFEPLGITSAGFGPPGNAGKADLREVVVVDRLPKHPIQSA